MPLLMVMRRFRRLSATVTTEKAEGVKPVGKLTYRGKELKEYDKLFEMTLRYFVNSVTFVQKYKITGKTYKVVRSSSFSMRRIKTSWRRLSVTSSTEIMFPSTFFFRTKGMTVTAKNFMLPPTVATVNSRHTLVWPF